MARGTSSGKLRKPKEASDSSEEGSIKALREKLTREQEMIDQLMHEHRQKAAKETQASESGEEPRESKDAPETRETIESAPQEDEPATPGARARRNAQSDTDDVGDLLRQAATVERTANEQAFDTITKETNIEKKLGHYASIFAMVRREVGKLVVGQLAILNSMLRAVLADGHVLVEGVPGIAKTILIRSLAKTMDCTFARIQFTPDLLPTDIIGISTYQEGKGFYTLKGPIFNNFILADEINRAPPKVQSALLESMAEKQATIAKETFPVPLPFFTMATQNPLENVGTYALPEAQMDRFLFKLLMSYPSVDEEQKVLRSNISETGFERIDIQPVLNPDTILQMQEDTKQIYVDKKVEQYIVRLIDASRHPKKYKISAYKYVSYGASPRGSIGMFKAARAEAMLQGIPHVTPHHVKTVAPDVLRHRILLNYEGQAEGVTSEKVIDELLRKVPVP